MENDLVDVLATFAGQTIRIGYIPAGESAEINIPLSSEEYTKWMDNSYQMLRQLFYGLGENDYNDDINCRSLMTNYLSGGSIFNPSEKGLKVPFELCLAIHSDAGYYEDNNLVGSLGIYTTDYNDGKTNNGI